MVFTLTQALQFAGIIPCLFVIIVLACIMRREPLVQVPVAYFCLLAVSFILPISTIIMPESWQSHTNLLLPLLAGLLPAASFLLIVQLAQNAVPEKRFWYIAALPLLGGLPYIDALLGGKESCLWAGVCTSDMLLYQFYFIFSGTVVFCLLVLNFSRMELVHDAQDTQRSHSYWLIVSLILMNLLLLVIMLAQLAERIAQPDAVLVETVIKLSFIYLVLTSLSRVFGVGEGAKHAAANTDESAKDIDPELIGRIHTAMEKEHLYREMGFSREALAKHLGVGAHVISKAINRHYEVNFNELVNRYRLDEAKERLTKEDTTVSVIAFDVGFNSIASFNRVFKQQVGSSPSAYRKAHQKK